MQWSHLAKFGWACLGDIELKSNLQTLATGWWLVTLLGVTLATTVFSLLSRTIISLPILAKGTLADGERLDFLVWGVASVCVISLVLWVRQSDGRKMISDSRTSGLALWVCFGILLLAIAWEQPLQDFPRKSLWFGFGVSIALASAAVSPWVSRTISRPSGSTIRFLALTSTAVVIFFYLPLLIQPPWGLIDPYHSNYVINEVLAQGSGVVPLGNQIPQYTSLLGWPLSPVVALLKSTGHVEWTYFAASMYLSFLAVVTVIGVVYTAWRTLPKRLRAIAALVTVPLILVKVQPPETTFGSIAGLFSAIPVRTLPQVGLGIALLWCCSHPSKGRVALVAAVTSLSAINNFEFGFPTAVAALLVLILITSGFTRLARLKILGLFACVVLGLAAAYLLVVQLLVGTVHPSFWLSFALTFASGFGAIEMPVFGTHILVLAVLGAGIVTGSLGLYSTRVSSAIAQVPREVAHQRGAAVIATFFGLTGYGAFGYYVGRSVTSGQLQIFLLNLALVTVASLSLVRIPTIFASRSYSRTARSLVLALPASLAFVAILQAPNPQYEWSRILEPKSGSDLMLPDLEFVALRDYARKVEKSQTQPVSLAVDTGNLASLVTGLPNASIVNSIWDSQLGLSLQIPFCEKLTATVGVIISRGFIGEDGISRCEGFRLLQREGDLALVEKIE